MGALKGLTVVALEQAVAAPLCTARLADAGARVIKIERPEGDFARGYDRDANGQASYFVWLNRGKESIALNLKQPDDLGILERMLDRADVFIQNLAPGAVERMGLGSDALLARNRRLIVCNISGYGRRGPFALRKAYDMLLQAETGLASVTGRAEGPGRVGVSVCDIACGMNSHAAILEALIARGISGKGRRIDVSLFDSLADWMTVPLLQYESQGRLPARVGLHHASIAPYGLYATGDGLLVLAIQNDREWQRFCSAVLQHPTLASDARFIDNTSRVANRAALDAAINAVLQHISRDDVVTVLSAANIAFAALNSVADFARHPQLRRITVRTESGPVSVPAPAAITEGNGADGATVPSLNQHGRALRKEFA